LFVKTIGFQMVDGITRFQIQNYINNYLVVIQEIALHPTYFQIRGL